MQIPVEGIIVKKRIRKDLGDIDGLAESLKRFGQINPIMISKKNELIAGGRRLEAARRLGWKTINAVVSESFGELEQLEMEIEENTQRRDLSMEEMAEATKQIYRLQNPGFFRRLAVILSRFFRRLFRIGDT